LLTKLRQIVSTDFWRSGDRPWYGSFGVSAAVHVGVIVVLGCLWISPGGTPEAAGIDSRWSPADAGPDMSRLEPIKQPTPADLSVAGGTNISRVMVASSAHRRSSADVRLPALDWGTAASWLADISDPDGLTEKVGAVTGGLGNQSGSGSGTGNGAGNGSGSGTGFFGLQVEGRKIVFVVDRSASMNYPHPGPAKTRFGRLKIELVRAISKMSPEMQFYVIFFNRQPLYMPSRTLQPATPDAQRKYLYWAAKVVAKGSTDPRVALISALRLRPDVIYFLTDGDFMPSVKRDLKKLRQRSVRIHTIAFGGKGAEDLLKLLAARNRGQYRYIP